MQSPGNLLTFYGTPTLIVLPKTSSRPCGELSLDLRPSKVRVSASAAAELLTGSPDGRFMGQQFDYMSDDLLLFNLSVISRHPGVESIREVNNKR